MRLYSNSTLDEAEIKYRKVQNTLSSIAQDYFDYLSRDKSIPLGEREKLIACDAKVFLVLAQRYHSAPTLDYIKSIVTEEIVQIKHKKAKSQESVKKRIAGTNKRNQIVNPVLPSRIKSREEKIETLLLPEGARSLDDMMKEMAVDRELFKRVLDNTEVKIERLSVPGSLIEYISQRDYEKVKKYIHELRS